MKKTGFEHNFGSRVWSSVFELQVSNIIPMVPVPEDRIHCAPGFRRMDKLVGGRTPLDRRSW